jgi:hypothetical protein
VPVRTCDTPASAGVSRGFVHDKRAQVLAPSTRGSDVIPPPTSTNYNIDAILYQQKLSAHLSIQRKAIPVPISKHAAQRQIAQDRRTLEQMLDTSIAANFGTDNPIRVSVRRFSSAEIGNAWNIYDRLGWKVDLMGDQQEPHYMQLS